MWEIFETSVAGNERQSSSRRIGRCKYGASCENVHFGRQEYSQISAMLIMLVFMHHGQICYGTERIIIMESIADNFISLMKMKVENFNVGYPVIANMSKG
jgi:hypothetical protein